MNASDLLLVGDIGGTKTDLLILSERRGIQAPLARTRVASAQYPDLYTLLDEFLTATGLRVARACLDVAGPVVDGRAHLTNLPWAVDGPELAARLGFERIDVVNDLAAIAHAIPALTEEDCLLLNEGRARANGVRAIIAPGTGLGEAFLLGEGDRYAAYPSEGGHADFAPPTAALEPLLPYIRARFGHASYELVCSGIGIAHLYDFFRERDPGGETRARARSLAQASDRTPLIITHALDPADPCPIARRAVEAFVTILGAEAGNLALKVFALGGVYIAGGIPPRLLPLTGRDALLQAFCAKGRFAALLKDIPLRLIQNPDVALIGAAAYGSRREKRSPKRAPRAV